MSDQLEDIRLKIFYLHDMLGRYDFNISFIYWRYIIHISYKFMLKLCLDYELLLSEE